MVAALLDAKARRHDPEGITARQQRLDLPEAAVVGGGGALDVGVFGGDGDDCVRNYGSLRVGDAAADGGANILRADCAGGEAEEEKKEGE